MAIIKLDYDPTTQLAIVKEVSDCSQRQWGAVRRLCEEHCSSTIVKGQKLELPWWEFLAFRDGFAFVLRSNGINIEFGVEAKELLEKSVKKERTFKEQGEVSDISEENLTGKLINNGFRRQLLPFQIKNVNILCKFQAAATFSVPGSGKTTEALAFFFLTKQPEDKLLIIAPNNAFVAWEDEIPSCCPDFSGRIERLTGGADKVGAILDQNPEVSIISYHQLPYVMGPILGFLARNRVYLFVDESHRMKRGNDGVHGSCILQLSFLAARKLIMSGTPMPNSTNDLVPQFRFLFPERRTSAESVVAEIRPFFVRTTKSQLKLPKVERIEIKVPMSDSQERLYNVLVSDAIRHLEGLDVRDRIRFRSVSRCVQYMLQAASNPGLLANSSISEHEILTAVLADGIPFKIREVCRIAREYVREGKKVVIWSCFVKTVEHIAELLADSGAEYIHGGVAIDVDEENEESREAIIRRFNDPDSGCRVLVANPAACSEGISLHHVCHHAIYVDRNYNAAQYLQSEDRIHRIGLPEDVTTYVIVLTSPGTIDESVTRRLADKVDRMALALDDPSLNINPIPLDELTDGIDEADIADLKVLLGVN